MALDGREDGEKLGRSRERETIIRIYHMEKKSVLKETIASPSRLKDHPDRRD